MTNGMRLGGAFRAARPTLWSKPDTRKSCESAGDLENAAGRRGPDARVMPRQSLVKTITWRGIAALDTFAISYLITGRFAAASSIVGVEALTKTAVYYGHERAWSYVRWGTAPIRFDSMRHAFRRGLQGFTRNRLSKRRIAVARLKRRSSKICSIRAGRSLAQFAAGSALMHKRIYFGAAFVWVTLFLVHWGVWTVRTLGRGWSTGMAFSATIVCTAIIAALLLGSAMRANDQVEP
jgi:uncharacterized membrane protein